MGEEKKDEEEREEEKKKIESEKKEEEEKKQEEEKKEVTNEKSAIEKKKDDLKKELEKVREKVKEQKKEEAKDEERKETKKEEDKNEESKKDEEKKEPSEPVVKIQLGFEGVKESCEKFAKTVVKIIADAMDVAESKVEAKPAADCSDESSLAEDEYVQDDYVEDEYTIAQASEKKFDVKITYDKLAEAKKAADISGSDLKAVVKKSVDKIVGKVEVAEVKGPS